MRTQTGFLALLAVLRGVSALYDLPNPSPARIQRRNLPRDVFNGARSDMFKRSTHDASLPLAFSATDKELYDGEFQKGRLAVTCIDCQTTGDITVSAMLPDLSDFDITDPDEIFDDSVVGLTFNGVGATIQIDLDAEAEGEFSTPLFESESPIGIAGPGFSVGIVFSVDLVLGLKGEIDAEAGFQVDIPHNSTFMITLDNAKPNAANFDGASVSLLPVSSNLAAEVTAALRLNIKAGVQLPTHKFFNATAVADAYISIPQVVLGTEVASDPQTCKVPLSAELNINAGTYIDIDAAIEGIDLGGMHPTASTTLFAASTSACLGSMTATPSVSGAPYPSGAPAAMFAAAAPALRPVTVKPERYTVRPVTMTMTSLATPITNYYPTLVRPTVV